MPFYVMKKKMAMALVFLSFQPTPLNGIKTINLDIIAFF